MATDSTIKLALLIDGDSAQPSMSGLLADVAKYGTACVKRAYGDWTGNQSKRLEGPAPQKVNSTDPAARIYTWQECDGHGYDYQRDGPAIPELVRWFLSRLKRQRLHPARCSDP